MALSDRARLRAVSWVLLIVFVAGAVAAFTVSRRVVNDQEQDLLAERAAEVRALLEGSRDSIASSLRVLGPIGASDDPASAALFADSAGRVLEGNTTTIGVAEFDEGTFAVVAAIGDGPAVGDALTDRRAALAARAFEFDEPQLVSDLVTTTGQTRLVLARRVRGVAAVAYQESVVTPDSPAASTPESPFRGLIVALYASPDQNDDRLVVTTDLEHARLEPVERLEFDVGADRWLLVVGAREPLLGPFAELVPWLLLVGGVVAALLVVAVIETLARRREFAIALVADRTRELEAALDELGETRSFLERLLTAGPMLVLRLSASDRQVTYVSPNVDSLFDLREREPVAPGFFRSSVVDDDFPGVDAALRRIEEGVSEREIIEYRIVRADEPSLWVAAVFVPETDDDDQVVAVLAYIVDVDDRRRAERAQREAQQAAETANRTKSEFLSRMSHELRTPLNAVLGFGQLLEIEELSEDQRDAVDHILKAGRHLLSLINEVLDISRIEAGELQLSPEPVLAADIIGEAVDLIRPLADQRGIQITLDRSGACDCYVYADRQRMKQVLLNLLSNAVKYNRSRGTVALSCEQPADAARVRISVADTGVGIPAERLNLLFMPFERLGAEHTAEEGAGIGLALSLKLAEAMGGTLTAVTKLGQGSTFTVELPRVEGPVERYERLSGASRAVESEPAPRADRFVVLHVEDNLSNVTLIERVLAQRPGVEVVAAMQGRLGLELAREHQPGLILLDLHLPDMGGDQVLQRLRDEPATASIPVVIVSADATEGQIRRLLTAGATAYLTKPIDVQQLLGIIDQARTTP
jgi:signal transduction histidine kinase/ActR/RegA family two-component response regulator